MNNTKQIEVLGSDGNIYIIQYERIDYKSIELSIIPRKVKVDNSYYPSNTDLHKNIVEHYIASIKRKYAPEERRILTIQRMLNSKQVNNHFDYLHLLQYINPMFNELLNNPCNDFGIKTVS